MSNKQILLPMDRLGVTSVQEDTMLTINFVTNAKKKYEVKWLLCKERLVTDKFPEGHIYANGGFLLNYNVELINELNELKITYDLTENCNVGLKINNRKIALYNGKGAATFCTDPLMEVLDSSGFGYEILSDDDIRKGLLGEFDIFLVPGGPDAGEGYYWGLGDKGYKNIKDYVYNKGQYFGICAGAYLPLTSLCKDNRYWLDLVDATDEQDLDYWRTGTGFVRIKILDNKHPIMSGLTAGGVNTLDMVYWEGPAMKPLSSNVNVIATYNDFIASGHINNSPRWDLLDNKPAFESVNGWYNVLTSDRFNNHLKGTAAMLETKINNNKMLLYSPHAEFGNIGIGERSKSQVFQLITNGLLYLSI